MKILKILGMGFLAMVALLVLLWGNFTYVTTYKITDIDTSASPDGTYELVFQAVGEPDFPFGASHAQIVLKQGNRVVSKRKFDVANDGATLWPENWTVQWQEDCARVLVHGEEQNDALYIFYFNGITESE